MNVNISHSFTGYRYAMETNDPRFVLSGYQKTDANVGVRLSGLPIAATVRFEVSNIFNSDYQVFPNYPMPLRTFTLKALVAY